jgi:CBS domain-containing protein
VGEVDLPVVSGETTIEATLAAMRTAMRSGLVTAREDRYVVLTDQDLIDAFRERGHREVAQVEPAHRTLVISPNLPRYRAMLERMGEFAAVDEFLRANYGHFALTRPTGSVVAVRTVSEAFAISLKQPVVVCTCTDDPNHKWRPAQLNDPSKCNLDGYKVNCK